MCWLRERDCTLWYGLVVKDIKVVDFTDKIIFIMLHIAFMPQQDRARLPAYLSLLVSSPRCPEKVVKYGTGYLFVV